MAKNKQISFDDMMEKVKKFAKPRRLVWPPKTYINDWYVADNMANIENDRLLLEHAVETATDFLTIDELITDYEEHTNMI